jgi:hypothetical protein
MIRRRCFVPTEVHSRANTAAISLALFLAGVVAGLCVYGTPSDASECGKYSSASAQGGFYFYDPVDRGSQPALCPSSISTSCVSSWPYAILAEVRSEGESDDGPFLVTDPETGSLLLTLAGDE